MLPKFSVKKPYTIIVSMIFILILGFISFTSMSTDLLPKMDLAYTIVMTTYVGASPEKVETEITKPIEQIAGTVSNVKNVKSVSSENSSLVIIEFNESVNMDSALIELNNSLDLIKSSFPDEASSPTIIKLNPDMIPIMVASIDVDNMNVEDVSRIVSDEILPKLERIDGVSSVSATGLVTENVKVILNQEKIDAINNKVLDSVNAKLAKTQKTLNYSKSKISSGKQALESQSSIQTEQIVNALSAIENGESQINSAESNLKLTESGMSVTKSVLEQTIETTTPRINALNERIKELESKENLNEIEASSLSSLKSLVVELEETNKNASSKLEELNSNLKYSLCSMAVLINSPIFSDFKSLLFIFSLLFIIFNCSISICKSLIFKLMILSFLLLLIFSSELTIFSFIFFNDIFSFFRENLMIQDKQVIHGKYIAEDGKIFLSFNYNNTNCFNNNVTNNLLISCTAKTTGSSI